jgi:hypothetical protein
MRQHRERRRDGLRRMTIQLRETEIATLIRKCPLIATVIMLGMCGMRVQFV